MKKAAILLAALLLIATLAACGSDSAAPNGDLTEVEFGVDNVVILWADDAVFDDPIILEDDGDLGGWVIENNPGAYWGITIPESGDYTVTVEYARGDPGVARGYAEAQVWNEETEEWDLWAGSAIYLDSTGDWSEYTSYSVRALAGLEEGQTYRFAILADSVEEADSKHFINLESVIIEPYSEEEDAYDASEEETDDSAGEQYIDADAPFILTNDDIYYHHESGKGNLQFHPDGRAQLNTSGSIRALEYTIEGDTVYITDEGEPVTELTFLDLCTLEDENGDIYAVPDSEGQELVERSIYWMNAGDIGIFFDILGILRTVGAEGEEIEGSYEVDGATVHIELGGETFDLEIQNRRVLYSYEDGSVFVRLP